MEKTNEDQYIKRMADLLRKGATLTDLSCPACASPLFRLKDGALWCGKDEKKVIIAKEGEKTTENSTLQTLETTLTTKIQEIQARIQKTENVDELQKLSSTLSELLKSLEKVKNMKS